MLDHVSPLVGVGPQSAARQAAMLFALAGVLAVVGVAVTPEHSGRLLLVATGDIGTAVASWWLPWRRWGRYGPAALGVPAFVILGFSTWAFGGVAAGTGPFFVLVFAWLGLHLPPWVSVAAVPVGLAAYVAPLVVTDQNPQVIASALVLLPTALGIALLIAYQVEHQRRDRERIAMVERWRAALAAALAHDLRSPLTTVQLALESIRQDGDEMPADQRDHLLGTALRQVGQITRLSSGLLDMERVDRHGELRLDIARVPVRRAVEEALELVAAGGVTVEIDPGLTLEADPERFQQMVINLTSNALRHGRPPIVITAGAVEGCARIEVRDHGRGVPEVERDLLFTAFHGGGAGGTGSVGLGLWIVDRLARAHGGRVRYEPADPGARMVLTLPLDQSRPERRRIGAVMSDQR